MRTSGGKLLTVLKGGGRTLTQYIADLFANGESGGSWDYKLSAVYQEDTPTTPAAVGQAFGYATDVSGNGNHATQGTADNKPTRLATGWQFDGTADRLRADGVVTFLSGEDNPVSTIARIRVNGGEGLNRSVWSWVGDTGSLPNYILLAASSNIWSVARRDNTASAGSAGGQAAAVGQEYTVISIDSGTSIRVIVNGNSSSDVPVNVGPLTLVRFAIGCRIRSSPDLFAPVTVKHLTVIDRTLTDSEVDEAEALLEGY